MRLVVFGASGNIGRRIIDEALGRGHDVTAVVRDKGRVPEAHARLRVMTGDALDPASVASVVKDSDAVISAIGPSRGTGPQVVVEAARSLTDGLSRAGVRRLVVVGGAGNLEVAPGVQLMDTPNFPGEWRPIALAHRDALAVYRTADLDWTYVSPPVLIESGQRTGKYQTGTDRLLTDEKGESSHQKQAHQHVTRRSPMYEPIIQRVNRDVVVILQDGGERAAVRRAVRMQVVSALGEVDVTAVSVQQIAYAAVRGSFQAAEQAGLPLEIVGEEASAGVMEAVKEKGGKATSHVQDATHGAMTAMEEYSAKLKEKASEVAERSLKALQSLIERLKASLHGSGEGR